MASSLEGALPSWPRDRLIHESGRGSGPLVTSRSPSNLTEGALLSWYEAKMFLEHAVSVSPDALHVIVGACFSWSAP